MMIKLRTSVDGYGVKNWWTSLLLTGIYATRGRRFFIINNPSSSMIPPSSR
jgi:hypothetical protein